MIDLDRLRSADPSYLDAIVRRYSREVMKAAGPFGEDRDEVEDLAQVVWVHVLNNLDSYNGRGLFGAWIYRVALNLCRSHARKQSTGWRARERMQEEGAFQNLHWMPPDPPSRLESEEEIALLHDALSRLPPRQRQAITLRCLQERPSREVAQIMGVEEATVRAYVSKGSKNLSSLFLVVSEGAS